MNTTATALKRGYKKYERLEIKAECPLCGHTAIIVFIGNEQEVYCPDKFCPNCKDNPHE